MTRKELLDRIADHVLAVRADHPVRVAVDGVDASGKTALADELVAPLRRSGRDVLRASIDGFHLPRERRHARGRRSPQGYYEDSFDLDLLRRAVLEPLGPGGDRRWLPAAFDWRADRPVDEPPHEAAPDAILVLDGVFLQRPELAPHWDLTVFLQVDFATSVERALSRDAHDDAERAELAALYRERYVLGQELYLARCIPRERAHLVVDNTDLDRPFLAAERA